MNAFSIPSTEALAPADASSLPKEETPAPASESEISPFLSQDMVFPESGDSAEDVPPASSSTPSPSTSSAETDREGSPMPLGGAEALSPQNEESATPVSWPSPDEVSHFIVGEMQSSETPPGSSLSPEKKSRSTDPPLPDDVWEKQKNKTRGFFAGLAAARKWAPLLEKDPAQWPEKYRGKMYEADLPDEWQHDEVKGDVVKNWLFEHFPGLADNFQDMTARWSEIKETAAAALNTAADHYSLYQEIARRNKEYNDVVQKIESRFVEVENKAYQGFMSPVEGADIRKTEETPSQEDLLGDIPENLRENVSSALSNHYRDEQQRVQRLKPLYEETRKAIKAMASFETMSLKKLPMTGVGGKEYQFSLPLMFDVKGLIRDYPSLPVTGQKLAQLSPEDRTLLLTRVEEDIIQEREKNPPEQEGMVKAMGHAISRSHMKGIYGALNLANAFDALSLDMGAQVLDLLPDSAITNSVAKVARKEAEKKRGALTQMQRLRDLAETRENPLHDSPDGRGAAPQRHWLKQCFLGFGEEAVPIGMSMIYWPSLLAWGGTTVGNKFARYETDASQQADRSALISNAMGEGGQGGASDPALASLPAPAEDTSKLTPAQASQHRFLSAMAMGSLQTLLEVGAYGKIFSPIVKSLPRASKAFGIGVRPYLEQKAISLTDPMGASLAEYTTKGMEEGSWDEFNTDRVVDSFGDVGDNTREYLMNLPFILLATGKVTLDHFKSRKNILNDPALAGRYRIPQKIVNQIKHETHPEKQSFLLQKALRESPVWQSPEVLYQSAHLLNQLEFRRDTGLTVGRYTPENLIQLLELPAEKTKNLAGIPQERTAISPTGRLVEDFNTPATPPNVPSPFSGKLTPLEKKQKLWHDMAELPTLTPVSNKNRLFWKMAAYNDFFEWQERLFDSPESAIADWEMNKRSEFTSSRKKALGDGFKSEIPEMANLKVTQSYVNDIMSKSLKKVHAITAERLLYQSHVKTPRQASDRSLNSLLKREREKDLAHTLEDSMQYGMGVPPQKIVANRLTRMWADELGQGRISPTQAKEWVAQWEGILGKKLTPLHVEGFSSRTPHAELATRLASMALDPDFNFQNNILPPSFNEPIRFALGQLAECQELAEIVPDSIAFLEKQKTQDTQSALYHTLSGVLKQPWETSQKYVTKISRPKEKTPALIDAPPYLSKNMKLDMQWLTKLGLSPLLSLTNKKGEVHWAASYPNGQISPLHKTPQEAYTDWLQTKTETNNPTLEQLGKKATRSLFELYYGKNFEKRPEIKLRVDTKPIKISPFTATKKDRERMKIMVLQNETSPLLLGSKGMEGLGFNGIKITSRGHVRDILDLHSITYPIAILEEQAEVNWRRFLSNDNFSEKEAVQLLKELEVATGNKYFLPKEKGQSQVLKHFNIREGLSQASTEYMMSQYQNPLVPQEFRDWVQYFYMAPRNNRYMIPLLRKSTDFKQVNEAGLISEKFIQLIQDSVGLNARQNKERAWAPSPHKTLLYPLLEKPSLLFEALPRHAQLSLMKKWTDDGKSFSPSSMYRETRQRLRSSEKMVKQYPALADWDYDPLQKIYTPLDRSTPATSEPPRIKGLKENEIKKEMETLYYLRRALDDSSYPDAEGIRFKDQFFSEKSPDRPRGMSSEWDVSFDFDSEGYVYTRPDHSGEMIRLSPGFYYDTHKRGRRPFIRHIVRGHYLDAQGRAKSPYDPTTFIPLEEFSYNTPTYVLEPPPHSDSILDVLSDPVLIKRFVEGKNVPEMTLPTELMFQLKEWEKVYKPQGESRKYYDSLFKEIAYMNRVPFGEPTDYIRLSEQAKELTKKQKKSPPINTIEE